MSTGPHAVLWSVAIGSGVQFLSVPGATYEAHLDKAHLGFQVRILEQSHQLCTRPVTPGAQNIKRNENRLSQSPDGTDGTPDGKRMERMERRMESASNSKYKETQGTLRHGRGHIHPHSKRALTEASPQGPHRISTQGQC
jgi:hypothetical protein